MEHAENVVVIEAPFEWDDLGSWRALERLRKPDEQGNVVDAARSLAIDTTGSVIRCEDAKHVVVTLGVENLIVIVTLSPRKRHSSPTRQKRNRSAG